MVHYAGITESHTDIGQWQHMVTTASIDEVLVCVKDEEWQKLRLAMKGTPLAERHEACEKWLDKHKWSRKALVQVSNYIGALKRGGMVR